MKNNIVILPEDLVDKIAAGEVVERPASVVKELVENSIDAFALSISVEIKSGGIKFIKVTDDGEGMSQEDAALALQRHATSKIKSIDDLYNIQSLGFRGEALPSIASVCLMELTTKTKQSLSGTFLKVEGSIIKEKKEKGTTQGTIVLVSELFYNTPARRKFLKTVLTETKHIIELLTNYALAYPEISFKFKTDGRELFDLRKTDSLAERIEELWGKDFVTKLVEIKREETEPSVSGFLGKPEICKSSRAQIHLFVNQRPVISRALNHAIQTGYGENLPQGKFPIAFVFIQIDPERIDVNVHPTKREVKFANENQIYNLLNLAVKKSLSTSLVMPGYEFPEEKSVTMDKQTKSSLIKETSPPYLADKKEKVLTQEDIIKEIYGGEKSPPKGGKSECKAAALPHKSESASGGKADTPRQEERKESLSSGNILFQAFDQYIVIQKEDELLILDQHASHERILYEVTYKNLTEREALSQKLLFPSVVELSPQEFFIYENFSDILAKIGFEIKSFGGKSVVIEAVPLTLKNQSEKIFLKELLADLDESQKSGKDKIKSLAQSFACKAAIKSGQRLSNEEMSSLYKQLFTLENPYTCPHGRPTVITIPLRELDKKFKRA
jgi:DNA mismatch repair protein MutL